MLRPRRQPSGETSTRRALAGVALLALAACRPAPDEAPDEAPFVALGEGRALDGRTGLALYAPAVRAAVLAAKEQEARYWARDAEAAAELEGLLESPEEDDAERFARLEDFVVRNAVMTESHFAPGIHGLEVDGDRARAYRRGENPGGEVREPLAFVRIGDLWFLTPASD